MTAIILAGGKSSRFGRDKAFVKINGTPMINRQVKVLAGIFKKIIIVTNSPSKYRFRNVVIIRDIVPDKGPLGGIYSGLKASGSDYNFVVACDMPFLNSGLVRYQIKMAVGYDATVLRFNDKVHPLHAVYTKRCLGRIGNLIAGDNLKVSRLLKKVKVRTISEKEIKKFDPDGRCLTNINTPGEYRLAVEPHGFTPAAPFFTGFHPWGGILPERHSSTALQPWRSGCRVK